MTNKNELDQVVEKFDAADIVWGAESIGREVNVDDLRKIYYLLERGHLPGKKVGRVWISSRRALRRAVTVAA